MYTIQAPRASAILYSLLTNRGDKRPWLLPANICQIVPIAFFKARVPFEFVDISGTTLHMDLDQAEALITKGKYGGLLYAHTYGESSTPHEFFAYAKSLDPALLILDDRCLCIPDLEPGEDTPADVILCSTGYAKIVELNFGGYAFMKNDVSCQPTHLTFTPEDHEQLEKSYKESISKRARFIYHDTNWLDTESDLSTWYDYCIQIRSVLKESLAQRRMLNDIYASRLPSEIQFPKEYQLWRFNIRVKNRKRVLAAIFNAGLFASSHYVSLAGIMAEGRAPQAERLASEVINLFNDHHFTAQQAERICEVIKENLD